MTKSALEGLRVLDLSTLFAAPQIGAMLGDLGADVVQLELPAGDPLRRLGLSRAGRSLSFAMVGRNKRCITLDLDRPEGREVFERLVEQADVLVENWPQSTLERWGATWPELSRRNPRLVVVSVSGFGRTGPYAERSGAGTLAEAFAGLTHMTGEAEGPPMLTSLPVGDILTAVVGVVGTLAACYHRDARGGQGQHVDVSMYEPVLELLSGAFAGWDGIGPPPMRNGSRVAGGVPRNVYRAGDDRWLVVSATTDAQAGRVLGLLGRDSAEDRERFGASAARLAHADELDTLVEEWIAARSRHEALEAFAEQRVPAGPINDLADLLADPHVRARGSLQVVDDEDLGAVTLVGPVPRLGGTPGRIRHLGPGLGAHNAEVYADWLSLDEAALADLRARGVV
ncbi:MAG: CoA transferase [Myxococcota bacterium]